MSTVEVRFKGTRKGYFLWPEDVPPLRLHEPVVVHVDRGRDLGHVTATGAIADQKCVSACAGCSIGAAKRPEPPSKTVLRRATPEDLATHHELRAAEDETRRMVTQRVRAHELIMKVSDCEWQWDRQKLTIYFTAEKRVDFRALVRDLASRFRTRIELRQIGVRDEAAQLSGVGRCGREYCCSTWLTELSPVSLGLAKDQHLSLNPTQISGGCGRLLCCLRYEHEFYVAARKRFPKEGKTLQAALGPERVVAVDIFRERVFLRSEEYGPRIIPLHQLHEEVERAGDILVTAEMRIPGGITPDAAPEEDAELALDERGSNAGPSARRGPSPSGGRPSGPRRSGERRSGERSFGGRSSGKRPSAGRPSGERASSERSSGERSPGEPAASESSGEHPASPESKHPSQRRGPPREP